MSWKALAVSIVLALAWTAAALYAVQPEPPAVAPIPEMQVYNVQFFDGEKTAVHGTSIRTAGFCVEILIGDRVDTIMCQVRYITETIPPEEGENPAPSSGAEPRVG